MAAGLRDGAARFPRLQACIVAAQDKVAVRLRFRGINSGEFLGIPAPGRTIEYVSHELYRIPTGSSPKNGSADTATLLRQLS